MHALIFLLSWMYLTAGKKASCSKAFPDFRRVYALIDARTEVRINYRSPANAIAFEDYAFADAGVVKYSDREGVDNYSHEQYNEFGWATSKGILSMNEMKRAEEKIGLLKRGNYPHAGETVDNKFVIQLGDEIGIDNVLIVTDKEYGDFDISRVYRINSEFETFNEQVRDAIYAAESAFGSKAEEAMRDLSRTEDVVCYRKEDYIHLYGSRDGESRRSGSTGGEVVQEVGTLQKRGRGSGSSKRNGSVAAALLQEQVDSDGNRSFS